MKVIWVYDVEVKHAWRYWLTNMDRIQKNRLCKSKKYISNV